MAKELASGRVGEVVFEVNAAMLQDEFPSLCAQLLRLKEAGVRFFGITEAGEREPVELETILNAGSCPFLIADFRLSHDAG